MLAISIDNSKYKIGFWFRVLLGNLDSSVLFDRSRRFRRVHSFPFCDINITCSGLCCCLDEGLYKCEALDSKDSCTYYFTTETEKESTNFKLYVQKDKGKHFPFFLSSVM